MESSMYSTFSKSVMEGVEKLLIEIDQKDTALPDDMVACFRNMSRTLQRILSKCDKNKSQSKSQNEKKSSNQSASFKPKPSTRSLFDESFLLSDQKQSSTTLNSNSNHEIDTLMKGDNLTNSKKTELSVDVEKIKKKMKKAIESDEEIDDSGILDDSILNLPKKLRNTYNSNHEVESSAYYKCEICDVTMNKNNAESHLNGKSHRSRVRESSSGDRKLSVIGDDDIERTLDGVKPQLKRNKDGQSYITHRSPMNPSYYCNVCKVEIAFVTTNLMQHVLGQQHKRLCEDTI